MNKTFNLPVNEVFTDLGTERVVTFHKVIDEECCELPDSVVDGQVCQIRLADVLADICVYCFSEAQRWGIPLEEVIHLVLDSQESKLVDGKPVMAEDGSKFIKGPFYVPPEEKIKAFLDAWNKRSL